MSDYYVLFFTSKDGMVEREETFVTSSSQSCSSGRRNYLQLGKKKTLGITTFGWKGGAAGDEWVETKPEDKQKSGGGCAWRRE